MIWFIGPYLLLLTLQGVSASPPEARLINDLLSGYVKEERPVLDSSKPVDVVLGVIMQNIINMNEKEEQLEVNAWLKYQWTDENLRWDPEHYENVTDLRHPAGSVWQPDILLYNSVDSSFDSTYKVNIVGYSNGIMEWLPPGIFKISCKLDVTYFPFDTQMCWFKFGSWTHNPRQVNLREGEFDFSEYMENGEWIVDKAWSNMTLREYGDDLYQAVYFHMKLKRRTLYYAFNLIMPCCITMILNVLGFTLRPESGEKVGLQISVSLAICIFLTMMNEMTPQTSEAVPLLGIFFQSCMVLSVFATLFTVYVQSYHFRVHQNTHRMHFWMRYFLLEWAPYVMRMEVPRRKNDLKSLRQSWAERKRKQEEENKTAFDYTTGPLKLMAAMSNTMKDNFDNLMFQVKVDEQQHKDSALAKRLTVLEKIYNHVKMIREHDDDTHEDKLVESEWRFAALVVDRLGLIIFSLMLLGTVLWIVLTAPYLFA
ncbi:unnamed protein product, partial [Mesorhabditis spiculigera]